MFECVFSYRTDLDFMKICCKKIIRSCIITQNTCLDVTRGKHRVRAISPQNFSANSIRLRWKVQKPIFILHRRIRKYLHKIYSKLADAHATRVRGK